MTKVNDTAVPAQDNTQLRISEAIWVVKPRSPVLHILAEKRFMPAFCGMVPPGKGRTPGQWAIVSTDYVARVQQGLGVTGSKLCDCCLKVLMSNH